MTWYLKQDQIIIGSNIKNGNSLQAILTSALTYWAKKIEEKPSLCLGFGL